MFFLCLPAVLPCADLEKKIGTKFSPGAPTPKRPSLRSDMGIGEPGGGKEREPRDNGEPSLPGGATI